MSLIPHFMPSRLAPPLLTLWPFLPPPRPTRAGCPRIVPQGHAVAAAGRCTRAGAFLVFFHKFRLRVRALINKVFS